MHEWLFTPVRLYTCRNGWWSTNICHWTLCRKEAFKAKCF
jgi:hypothetical protein